jgi:hypothetical protein
VRQAGIRASCDGARVLEWSCDPSSLTIHPGWSVAGREDCLILGAQGAFQITKLTLTPLSADLGNVQRTPVAPNTLTRAEARDGWTLLFDGRSTDGWRCYVNREPAEGGWSVADGWLKLAGAKDRTTPGTLMSRQGFASFDLRFDWRISSGGQSGLFYGRCQLPEPGKPPRPGADRTGVRCCEYQLLDDPAYPNVAPNALTGALWGVLAPGPEKRYLSGGQINRSRILVRGNHVEHWLNGSRILSYDAASADFRGHVAAGPFKDFPEFGRPAKRPFLLQDSGDEIWFRNVKVRELPADGLDRSP